jgi:hypothetical protein
MTYRMYGAFAASLVVVALVVATSETFAGSAAVAVPARGAVSAHPVFRPSLAGRSQQHRRGNNAGGFWGGGGFDGSYGYGYGYGDPGAGVAQPGSNDTRYTYTYDVPWDAIHRFPPMVAPSDKPYVSECPTQTVTVPGRESKEQTVNITRCY